MEEIIVDQLEVVSVNKEGKVYDKVSRSELNSRNFMITIDHHTYLLPLKKGDLLSVIIYKGRINEDEVPKEYEYLMSGKCYKRMKKNEKNIFYASFGGLLMIIETLEDIDLCDLDDVGFACKKM